MYAALRSGDGPANLLHFLLHHRYDRHLLSRPIDTAAKADQIARSLPLIDQWWLDRLAEGDCWADQRAQKDAVYAAFVMFCDRRRARLIDARQFWKRLRTLLGGHLHEVRCGSGPRGVFFPSLAEARAAFEQVTGVPVADVLEADEGDALELVKW